MSKLLSILTTACLLAACSDGPQTQATPDLVVMTQNLYLGAALEPILAARADSVPIQAAMAWGTLAATNFPERAGALAHQIAAHSPHVVGLQEVALFRVQIPGDLVVGGTTPATSVAYDFLSLLLDSLRVHGATYTLAAADTTIDLEIPAVTGVDATGTPTFMDIRYTDRDVVLVAAGVTASAAASARYAAGIPINVAGMALTISRGWSAVTATVHGRSVRFYTTHLEDLSRPVQEVQATEMLAAIAAETLPVVVTGDLNSDAEVATTATYAMVTGAGFRDVWEVLRPSETGFTCCQAPTLDDAAPAFDQRLDLVLVPAGITPVSVDRVNADGALRTAAGLWPSDHAGVVASLRVPR